MVWKVKFLLLSIICFVNIQAQEKLELFFTDKYNVNYFSSAIEENTIFVIGSDVFTFLESQHLSEISQYIDSFLTTENISFNRNVFYNGRNRFEIELFQMDAEKCAKLSALWYEKYNINWLLLLREKVSLDRPMNSSNERILGKISKIESSRFLKPTNTVNNSNIAFILSKNNSNNNFNKVFTYINTSRITSNDPLLRATEISYNNDLKTNQMRYIFPSINKFTFLRTILGVHILSALNETPFDIEYNINQSIISILGMKSSSKIDSFGLHLPNRNISEKKLNELVRSAYSSIINNMNKETMFFYSYFDLLKLKAVIESYDIEDFQTILSDFNDKRNFILELSPSHNFSYKGIKLKEYSLKNILKEIPYLSNSIKFKDENDSTAINDLIQFLKINTQYDIIIEGHSKKNEYIFIEKEKKDKIISKYKDSGYAISFFKRLKLFRSLVLFEKLTSNSIDPKRIKCIGLRSKKSVLKFHLIN